MVPRIRIRIRTGNPGRKKDATGHRRCVLGSGASLRVGRLHPAAALAAIDELSHALAALAAARAEQLRAPLAAHHLAAFATDLAVELGAVPFLGGLTTLLAQLSVPLPPESFLAVISPQPLV